jgi:hypothetical protein
MGHGPFCPLETVWGQSNIVDGVCTFPRLQLLFHGKRWLNDYAPIFLTNGEWYSGNRKNVNTLTKPRNLAKFGDFPNPFVNPGGVGGSSLRECPFVEAPEAPSEASMLNPRKWRFSSKVFQPRLGAPYLLPRDFDGTPYGRMDRKR